MPERTFLVSGRQIPRRSHDGTHPVWLKYYIASCHLAIIVAQQPTEALPSHHWTHVATNIPRPRDQLVVKTLVVALRMIVRQVLVDHIIQRVFTHHDHLPLRLFFDRAHKS